MMQMVLSDGRIKTFEVSVHQFNQLRFGVAKVLKDMQVRMYGGLTKSKFVLGLGLGLWLIVYTGGVIFHVEWCIRLLALLFIYHTL